jgi:hypothetical protein
VLLSASANGDLSKCKRFSGNNLDLTSAVQLIKKQPTGRRMKAGHEREIEIVPLVFRDGETGKLVPLGHRPSQLDDDRWVFGPTTLIQPDLEQEEANAPCSISVSDHWSRSPPEGEEE